MIDEMGGGWYNKGRCLRFWSIILSDNKLLLQNILSLWQVTAILNSKDVFTPHSDIAWAMNSYEIYERLDALDPYSVKDLLTVHSIIKR